MSSRKSFFRDIFVLLKSGTQVTSNDEISWWLAVAGSLDRLDSLRAGAATVAASPLLAHCRRAQFVDNACPAINVTAALVYYKRI